MSIISPQDARVGITHPEFGMIYIVSRFPVLSTISGMSIFPTEGDIEFDKSPRSYLTVRKPRKLSRCR